MLFIIGTEFAEFTKPYCSFIVGRAFVGRQVGSLNPVGSPKRGAPAGMALVAMPFFAAWHVALFDLLTDYEVPRGTIGPLTPAGHEL